MKLPVRSESIEPRTGPKGQPAPAPDMLRVIPLGGVGEFGKNMMVVEFGDDMVCVDCGQKFPEEEMLGVDLVIPDFGYVLEAGDRLRGLVLTHGHEDHLGAVPHLLRQMTYRRLPIYGSRLTLALLREKLIEMDVLDGADLIEVADRELIDIGALRIAFFQVPHSFPDAMALVIETPVGALLHTGDFKFEPVNGGRLPASLRAILRHLKGRRPLLLMADSTNIDRDGHSPNETQVREGLTRFFRDAPRTIILTSFSTNIDRIQTILDLAHQFGRKVAICGFSLDRNFNIAGELGLLQYPAGLVLPLHELRQVPPESRVIITTGSQGEPLSALSRMALNSFRGYTVQPEDLIIFSSRIIPGNERSIYKLINHFYRHGAKVVTERDGAVHASGHAYRDEMRLLLREVRPRFFMPIHGELRQLMRHGELAIECGLKEEEVFILENGMQLNLGEDWAEAQPTDWAGIVLVDGRMMDGVEQIVLRDRKHLAEDGMLTVILVIDKQSHRIMAGPDLVSRGFIVVDNNEPLMQGCKDLVARTFEECPKESQEEWDTVKAAVRKALRRYLADQTDRYPVILPVVVEI